MIPPATQPASPDSASPRPPADRYGRPRSLARPLIVALVALAVAAAGWIGWGLYQTVNPPVKAGMVGWTVPVDGKMTATIEIRRTSNSPVTCDVVAVDDRLAEVGRSVVRVPADGRRHLRTTTSIAVEGRAVAAEIRGCELG